MFFLGIYVSITCPTSTGSKFLPLLVRSTFLSLKALEEHQLSKPCGEEEQIAADTPKILDALSLS